MIYKKPFFKLLGLVWLVIIIIFVFFIFWDRMTTDPLKDYKHFEHSKRHVSDKSKRLDKSFNADVKLDFKSVFEILQRSRYLNKVSDYYLATVGNINLYSLREVSKQTWATFNTFEQFKNYNVKQVYTEFEYLVDFYGYDHLTEQAKTPKEIATVISAAIEHAIKIKLWTIFIEIKHSLEKIHIYGITALDSVDLNDLNLLDSADWLKITSVNDLKKDQSVFLEFDNLVKRFKTAAAINEAINALGVRNILKYIWNFDRVSMVRLFRDIDQYYIDNILGVDISVLRDLKTQLDKGSLDWNSLTSQQSAKIIELFEVSGAHYIKDAFIILENEVKQLVETKLQKIFAFKQVKATLKLIHDYRLNKIISVAVDQLQNINNWKTITSLKQLELQFPVAYEEFQNLVKQNIVDHSGKERTIAATATAIIASIKKTKANELNTLFARIKNSLMHISTYDLNHIDGVAVTHLKSLNT